MLKIIKMTVLAVFLFSLSAYAYYSYNINTPINNNGQDVVFAVEKGDGVNKISAGLKKVGLIRSSFIFETYVWLQKKQSNFQAGEYVLSPKLSMREIVKVLVKGETLSKERNITIIEGWSAKDIAKYLEDEKISKADDFLKLAGYSKKDSRKSADAPRDYSDKYKLLIDRPDTAGLEGYLFPDTYRIFKDAVPDDIINKMLGNLDRKLTAGMRSEIARQGKTVFQIMTMASLVEKEVIKEEDMKLVAGIFWNRIRNGQALESCASLAYILGVNKAQYSIEDTKINSPYNTYQHRGLPPGPIANAGLKAITAAIYPAKTDFNYFLSVPETHETIFSKTYDEHIKNKNKYLK